ncbi:MAG: phosphoglycerate dehydrogenase [Elusimicrobia bacterium]|nr:phosphoglycerate dehydrogenase [Elusimicrobiota bacterium]
MSAEILVSTRSFGKADPAPLERLKLSGLKAEFNPYGRQLEIPETIQLLKGKTGLIAGTETLNDEVFAKVPDLRVISRVGTGMNNVDQEAAKRRGIQVFNTPDSPAQAVGELVLGLILGLLRRIPEADRQVRSGTWEPVLGRLLSEKTVGIVGLGRVGRHLAGLLSPFRPKLLAYDPAPDASFARERGVRLVELDVLLADADIVTLHSPLTHQTRGMIGPAQLSRMRKDAVLINTARGGLVDEVALHRALAENRLAGAALDVFEAEPYKGPLRDLPNVILCPHMGSSAAETRVKMELESVDNLLKGLKLIKEAA